MHRVNDNKGQVKTWIFGVSVVIAVVVGLSAGYLLFHPPVKVKKKYSGVALKIIAMKLPATKFMGRKAKEWEEDMGADVTFDWLGERDLRALTIEDMAAGIGTYQIIMQGTWHVPLMVTNDWVIPLNEYFTPEYKYDDFFMAAKLTASYGGKQYGLPIYFEATQLVYRKDLFEKENYPVPRTLEDVTKAAKHFNRPEEGIYGIALRGRRGCGLNVISWLQYLQAYGGELLETGEPPYHCICDSPEAVRATEWYTNLVQNYAPPGCATFHWSDVQAAMMGGRVAMIIDATSIGRRVAISPESKVRGKVGFALFPAGPAGRYPWFYGWDLYVSKVGCKTRIQREAAIDFLLWATSPEMKKEMLKAESVLPARKLVMESELAKEIYGAPEFANWREMTMKNLALKKEGARDRRIWPYNPKYPAIGDELGIYLEEIFTAKRGVEEGLREAAKAINTKIFKE